MGIGDNINAVRENIRAACTRAGRTPDGITILAATKTRSAAEIREALECGITAIGENTVQEAEGKLSLLPSVERHFIGHLQSNKAGKAVELFDCIQSIDSLKLAKDIDVRARDAGKVMKVMIEINTAKEGSKFDIAIEDTEKVYGSLLRLANIKVIGIMSVLPYIEAEQTRPYYKKLAALRKKLSLPYLSAGMSNDYAVAVEEGANMLRLGTAIFGPRN